MPAAPSGSTFRSPSPCCGAPRPLARGARVSGAGAPIPRRRWRGCGRPSRPARRQCRAGLSRSIRSSVAIVAVTVIHVVLPDSPQSQSRCHGRSASIQGNRYSVGLDVTDLSMPRGANPAAILRIVGARARESRQSRAASRGTALALRAGHLPFRAGHHNQGGSCAARSAGVLLQRPGDRSRHGQHLRLRPRAGHRAERAVDRRRQQRQRPDRSRRQRSQGDARPDARQHHRDPADARRRHRRLRRRREDARLLHQEGARPQALRPPARRHRRAVGDHAGRAPRRQGQRLPRQGERGAPGRRRHGGRDRRRPADHRSVRQHDRRHRRRHDRHRRDLAGRRRLQPVGARRRQRDGRGDHAIRASKRARPADRRAHGRADQDGARFGGAAVAAQGDGGQGPPRARRQADRPSC